LPSIGNNGSTTRAIEFAERGVFLAVTVERRYSQAIRPLHSVLLAGAVPLFVGAALSDVAYASSDQIQATKLASWLIVGGLVFAGVALLFAIADLFRAERRARGIGLYVGVLLLTWVAGFLNALVHARDAWASMPTGLALSVVVAALACVATWIGFRR